MYEGFNPNQLKAINHYMLGKTRAEACVAAGYNKSYGNEFFDRKDVQKEVERRKKRMVERNKVNEDWIVERLTDIAGGVVGELVEVDPQGQPFFDWTKLSPSMRRSLGGLKIKTVKGKAEVEIKPLDQLRALELLGKHLGMFKEKVEVNIEEDSIQRLIDGRLRVAAKEEAPAKYNSSTSDVYELPQDGYDAEESKE